MKLRAFAGRRPMVALCFSGAMALGAVPGWGMDLGTGMDMAGANPVGKVVINQFEATRSGGVDARAWEAYAWYGSDANKFLLRTQGDRAAAGVTAGDFEALWSHAVGAFWDSEAGLRRDCGGGPTRDWVAFGPRGIAPYWLGIEATGYAGGGGRAAARLKVEYDLRITQRLVLQPDLETNLYARSDAARRLGSGITDASARLRLRYEIRREFAPYVGVVWQRAFGGTAGFRRADRLSVVDCQFVAGLRIWF